MKKSLKTYHATKSYRGYTVLVYGERWEDGYVDGIVVARAKFSRDGKRLMNRGDYTPYLIDEPYTRTRYFNMGYAICAPQDTFNFDEGIKICRRRFKKEPMMAKSGLFLTDDMINAIIDNEVHYIISHWDKFNPPQTVEEYAGDGEKTDEAANAVEVEDEKENNAVTEEAPSDEPVGEKELVMESLVGKYVYRKSLDGSNVVGLIGDEDEHNYYFLWRVRYLDKGDDKVYKFEYTNQSDVFQIKGIKLRLATPDELLEALKQIKDYSGLSWNGETKQFEK